MCPVYKMSECKLSDYILIIMLENKMSEYFWPVEFNQVVRNACCTAYVAPQQETLTVAGAANVPVDNVAQRGSDGQASSQGHHLARA